MMTRPQYLGQRLTATTKRAFDIFIAGAMLIFFAPLFLTIAFLIRRRGDGPIIFSHPRIGRKGRTFRCLKFRTMVPDADKRLAELLSSNPHLSQQWQSQCKLDPDPRVIPGIGEFLRGSSLDELPQLWNVLMGDMSIVGPRPVTEAEFSRYGD